MPHRISLTLLFLLLTAASASGADYAAQFVSQAPQGLGLPYVAGQTAAFQLSYKNTGTVYWTNTRDATDPLSIELRSVTAADSSTLVDSSLYPGQGPAPLWVNRQRVVGPNQTRVDPGQTADFIFTVKIPTTPGHYRLFFRPFIYGTFPDQGRYFDLNVTAPAVVAPSDLIALATGISVDLTWQDNSDNEDGFQIEKKIGNSGIYFPFKTLPAGTTSYRDTEVSANWKYFYRVRAFKESMVSDWVEYYALVLAAAGNLSATVRSQTEIDLTWTDNTLGETGFKVYRKTSPGAQWTEISDLTSQAANHTSLNDNSLAFETTYYYGVRAYSNSTTPTPHFSDFAFISATTQSLSTEPNWVKTYRLGKSANGHQDHLHTTKLEEKNSAEAAGYMFDGEDFQVSSTPFVGCNEVVRLRKNGPGYVIRLYTADTAEIESALAQGYIQESPSLGYVYAIAHLGMAEIKRCFHQGITDRFYTAYDQEVADAVSQGYREENSLSIVFARSYNSRDPYFQTGSPGHGWTHSFNLKIVEEQCCPVSVIFADRHGEIFTPSENKTFIPEKGIHNRLSHPSGEIGYILTTKEQLQYFFDENLGLDRIEDRNQNTIKCVYDAEGKLSEVVALVGRTFTFFHDPAGHMISTRPQIPTSSGCTHGERHEVQLSAPPHLRRLQGLWG